MDCPYCSRPVRTRVLSSTRVRADNAVRRRRECISCKGRFSTVEHVDLRKMRVRKRNGDLELFDRGKLARSLDIALQNRNKKPEHVEALISDVARSVEDLELPTVSTEKVGNIVMSSLARFDDVAYVRFASVYKRFASVDDFVAFLRPLQAPAGRR